MGQDVDIVIYDDIYVKIKIVLNEECWNEEDGFYYDLGFGEQI